MSWVPKWTLNTLLRSWYCRLWDPIEDCWGWGRLCSIQYRFSEMVGIGRGMGRLKESGLSGLGRFRLVAGSGKTAWMRKVGRG